MAGRKASNAVRFLMLPFKCGKKCVCVNLTNITDIGRVLSWINSYVRSAT